MTIRRSTPRSTRAAGSCWTEVHGTRSPPCVRSTRRAEGRRRAVHDEAHVDELSRSSAEQGVDDGVERSSARGITGRFGTRLTLIALAGFAIRMANLAVSRRTVQGDGTYYHAIAGLLADGKGFVVPSGQPIPWAPHPPLWPLLLALPARLGLRTYTEQQVIAALVGTATIVVLGLAGRRLATPAPVSPPRRSRPSAPTSSCTSATFSPRRSRSSWLLWQCCSSFASTLAQVSWLR